MGRPKGWLLGVLALHGAFILACTQIARTIEPVAPIVGEIDPDYKQLPYDCDEPIPTKSPTGCCIERITCGDTVQGNTKVGKNHWGDDFYRAAMCTPGRADYEDAPEAIYELDLPADIQADVTLISGCEDLDLVAVGWKDTSRVPTEKHHVSIVECEMDDSKGGGSVRITTVNRGQTFLLGVDGKHGATGNFQIDVKCTTYR